MEMVLTKRALEYFMDRERLIHHIDKVILFCFCVLVIFLPIAHTESVRAFAFGIPAGLWIVKMLLTRRFLFSRTYLDLPILFFSIIAGLSILTAVDPEYSLREFLGEWVTCLFLFYLVINNFHFDQIKYILCALLIGNLLMINFGIYEFFREGGVIFSSQIRVDSLHSGVGAFSTYLVTVMPYILVALFFAKKIIWFPGLFLLLTLNIFTFVLTYSRGSLIAIAVLGLFAGWKYVSKKAVISLLGVGILAIFFFAPQKIEYYYRRITIPPPPGYTPDSYHGRWILLKFTLEKVFENPFRMIGYGRRSFIKKFQALHQDWEAAKMWHAHNAFLDIALQTGIQGLLFFLFLIYRILKYCHARSKLEGDPLRKFYLSATFIMIIVFFVRNLSDDFFIDDSALLLWFLIGMTLPFANTKSRFLDVRSGCDGPGNEDAIPNHCKLISQARPSVNAANRCRLNQGQLF